MTKEEILAMEAGRELDALVDKYIFDGDGCVHDLYWVDPEEYACSKCHKQFISPEPWSYSTDILAASKIIEKEGAWDIKKRFRPHRDDPAGSGGRPTYQAICFLSDYDEYEDELFNKRTGRSPWCWILPMAICLAALLAKLEGGK